MTDDNGSQTSSGGRRRTRSGGRGGRGGRGGTVTPPRSGVMSPPREATPPPETPASEIPEPQMPSWLPALLRGIAEQNREQLRRELESNASLLTSDGSSQDRRYSAVLKALLKRMNDNIPHKFAGQGDNVEVHALG